MGGWVEVFTCFIFLFWPLSFQGEKAKERKERRESALASGFKGATAVREVAMIDDDWKVQPKYLQGLIESDYTSSASGTE